MKENIIFCPVCEEQMKPLFVGSNIAFICKKCNWIREVVTRRPEILVAKQKNEYYNRERS